MRPAATIVVLVCLGASVSVQRQTIDEFFATFSDEWVSANPNLATNTRYFTGETQDRLEQQLTPLSIRARRSQLARQGLAELRRFDRTKLTDTQRVSAELLEWQLQTTLDGDPFEDYSFPFETRRGVNVTVPNALTVVHPMQTAKDAAHYVARLRQVRPRVDEALERARALAPRGFLPPRFILNSTIASMRQFVSTPPEQNPFATAFADKAARIADLPASERAALQAQVVGIVTKEVYPGWQDAIAFLESLMARATDDAGLWRLPGGNRAYEYFLRRATTTNLTADQVHQIGLKRVAEIQNQMDALLRKLGRTEGTIQERIARLKQEMSYPNTDAGRAQIMADINGLIRDAEQRAALLFDRRPKQSVIAQPFPKFRWDTAPASYVPPPLDGSRPGIFQMPLRPDQLTKLPLRTLVYHETIPGHHFQAALMRENSSLPRFRQASVFGGIDAVGEGWALYVERLVVESGWYGDDIHGLLGQLDDELFRARRLVVDTGLHARRWTRQQAIDYGIEPSEVDRYVLDPGQACSYMIGQLKIFELRDKARRALGGRFSDRAFHNVVLGAGLVPLSLLEREVDSYIAQVKHQDAKAAPTF